MADVRQMARHLKNSKKMFATNKPILTIFGMLIRLDPQDNVSQ